jgi:hypothetical protein
MAIAEKLHLDCNTVFLPHYISCANIQKLCILPADCIYVLLTIFRMNGDYFSSVFVKEMHCFFVL